METMMRTLLLPLALSMVVACGGGGTNDGAQAPAPPPADTTAQPPAPAAPPRTMGTARSMQTSAENLLFDPTFSTLGNSIAFDLYGDGAHAMVPATSPAGPASTVLVVDGSAQTTNEYLMFGQGGSGPLDVRIFVATSKAQKDPVPVYFASMMDQNAVFQLDPVDGADQKHGALTYKLYEAKVPGPVYGMVALAVDVSDTTTTYTFAAPEITSAAGLMTTMSLSRPARRIALPAAVRAELEAVANRPFVPGPSGETSRVKMKVPFAR